MDNKSSAAANGLSSEVNMINNTEDNKQREPDFDNSAVDINAIKD